jgi:hypothetical protein
MTEERLVLAELLEKAGESDFLRAVAEAVLQLLMETDVEGPLPRHYRAAILHCASAVGSGYRLTSGGAD